MTERPDVAAITPDDVAASLARGDGGFGRNQQSYFDHPILQKAHWEWQIEWYFYIGGIASGSALLATLATRFGDPNDAALVRNGRYLAIAGAAASGVLLILDLGKPERFLNMLRIVKLKSPMSVGVYALSGFSALAGLAFAEQIHADGIIPWNLARPVPPLLRDLALAPFAALLGSYTGVLISATAIPVWFSGRRTIPAIFVCSATATACAINLALLALAARANPATMRKLERLQIVAALGEGALLRVYERTAGELGAPLFRGAIGKRLTLMTEVLGTAVPNALNLAGAFARKDTMTPARRARALLAAGLTLAGGFVLRQSLLAAGRASADDPRAYLHHKELQHRHLHD
jgi:formate-dependent nitrite reductase membrane component NrfD